MILNDLQIKKISSATALALEKEIFGDDKIPAPLIEPFVHESISQEDGVKILSYGLSSFGYDIRLSEAEFMVFRHIPGEVVDPLNFNPKFLEKQKAKINENTGHRFFILPAHSYALGVAEEKLCLPGHITAVCIGKSSYARSGIIVNITPIEAGWEGYLTIELSNSSDSDCRIYANQGIAQVLFFQGKHCLLPYCLRGGKYQHQKQEVTLPR